MILNDVCDFIVDCHHSTARDEGQGFPLIRTANVGKGRLLLDGVHRVSERVYRDRNSRAVPQKDDIIFAREAPVGNAAIVEDGQKVCLGQRTVLIRPNAEAVEPQYLVYYLLSPAVQAAILAASHGALAKHINVSALRNLNIRLHDRETQKKIGAVFSAIDEKIRINERLIDSLERYADTLYKHWFVDLEFPDENGRPYRSAGGAAVFNAEQNAFVPSGWSVVPLLDTVVWSVNTQPPKKTFIYEPRRNYVRFLQNRDYSSDSHITYIPIAKTTKLADRFDILIDKYGDAGKVRYGLDGAFSVALAKLQVKEPIFTEYIRSYFLSENVYRFLHNSCAASTRASLSKDNLAPLRIALPPLSLVSKYQKTVRTVREYILAAKNENTTLSKLKEHLIADVFFLSGT